MLDLVQEIGAAAGFAAAVGLAVLSALHFSHARDVKRLREWAERAGASGPAASRAVPQQTVIVPPRGSQPWYTGIGTRDLAVALVVLVVLGGAAAYGVAQLTGNDGRDNARNAQANHDRGLPDKPERNGAAITPGKVTVAVLNGTTAPGLAAALRERIAAAGFKTGAIDVFSDQQLAASVVHYAPGHQAAAKAVGRIVGVSRLKPATANSRGLAGDATVIVIAGADQAS